MSPAIPSEHEARGVGRVEAFSDGVIAIIITIMVLELKAPVAEGFEHVIALWPVLLAYLLSYVYVGLYWGNHHRLLGHATRVSNGLIWANLALLFGLSLVPFATAYLGEHHFDRTSTWLYLATMLLPAIGYVCLETVIRRTGRNDPAVLRYHRRSTRKGVFAMAVYALGFALTDVAPWLGLTCAAMVAALWVLPDSRLDSLFGR